MVKRKQSDIYFAIAFCFICSMLLIKTVGLLLIWHPSGITLFKALVLCTATTGIFSFIVAVIYFLTNIFSRKTAEWLSSILFGIILFGEIGLEIYARQSGQLMGVELFLRPLSELYTTVSAEINPILAALIFISVVFGFSALSICISKTINNKITRTTVVATMAISIPLLFLKDVFVSKNDNINDRNVAASKVWYMLESITGQDVRQNDSNVEFDEKRIAEFLTENPDYVVPDKHYPLERIDNTPDVIGSFFEESDTAPDIVILVVESLGHEIIEGGRFAPFIDSLARNGLYWENCLSTTKRSFGAVPAITASSIGPKGFQFGIMPKHNSILSILKSNGYTTNAFYGGDFSFDCISEFLVAQDIDFMSDFYAEYKKSKDNNLGNWWGYYDNVMFDRSLETIKGFSSPMANLLITITGHGDLDIKDESLKNYYIEKADNIISNTKSKQNLYKANKMRLCSMLYADDCVKDFINGYKQMPNYDNTIFIITGDHSTGLFIDNKLSYFKVPLVIWSPMLKETRTFKSVVTHLDIAPTITALLKNKYHLETPQYVHWVSDGLDTSNQMNFNKIFVHVDYGREMKEMLYGNYYYWTKNPWEPETVCNIDDDLNFEIIDNDSLKAALNGKLELYKYILRYTYHNDKLASHAINSMSDYQFYTEIHKKDNITCTTPDTKPSETGPKHFALFKSIDIKDSKKVKATLEADIYVNDSLWQDQYMDIIFELKNDSKGSDKQYRDKFSKFIVSDSIRSDTWYKLFVSKEFLTESDDDYSLNIYVSSVMYDNEWVGGSTITIGDRRIKVETVSEEQTSH